MELTNLSNNFSALRASQVKETDLEDAMPPYPGKPFQISSDEVSTFFILLTLSCFFYLFLGCRERICGLIDEAPDQSSDSKNQCMVAIPRPYLLNPKKLLDIKGQEITNTSAKARQNDNTKSCYSARCLLRSDSISASRCVGVEGADYL